MKRSHWLLVAAVLILGFAAWRYFQPGEDRPHTDLIETFPTAMERKPTPESFQVIDATIAGVTKRAIFTTENTRIRWKITVPDNAWLRVSLGIKEEAWKEQGTDGVLFYIGMTDGGAAWDHLLSMTINPAVNLNERVWQDQLIDLTQYAGESMELVFKTNFSSSPPDNKVGDLALWGEPRIVIR